MPTHAIDRGLNKKRRTPRSISNEPLTLWGRSSDVGVDGLCWWQAESEGHGADADTSESSEPTTGVSESTCLAALTQTRHRPANRSFFAYDVVSSRSLYSLSREIKTQFSCRCFTVQHYPRLAAWRSG